MEKQEQEHEHNYEIIPDSEITQEIGYRKWEKIYIVYCRKCLQTTEMRREIK